jgi:SAM-dependent methyltransferase
MTDKPEALEAGDQSYFLQGWRIYRTVLDRDYMCHRGVYALLHRVLVEEAPRRFRFLDVACGDAAASVSALRETGVVSYTGIDISRMALDLARAELAGLDCPVVLLEQDFREALAGWRDPVDVVWIGQSLHHLAQPEDKLALMREVRRVLGPGGLFLIWEPTNPAGEDREGWLALVRTIGRERYAGLGDEDGEMVYQHCAASDYPETAERWLSLGLDAGFASAAELLEAPPGLARVYRYSVEAAAA